MQGRQVEVVNLAENGKEDLMQDFVSIVTAFCARRYGQRRSRRKAERILAELQNNEESHSPFEIEAGKLGQTAKAGRAGQRTPAGGAGLCGLADPG